MVVISIAELVWSSNGSDGVDATFVSDVLLSPIIGFDVALVIGSIVVVSDVDVRTEFIEEPETVSIVVDDKNVVLDSIGVLDMGSNVVVNGWTDEVGGLVIGRFVEICTIAVEDIEVDWTVIEVVFVYMLLASVVSEEAPWLKLLQNIENPVNQHSFLYLTEIRFENKYYVKSMFNFCIILMNSKIT